MISLQITCQPDFLFCGCDVFASFMAAALIGLRAVSSLNDIVISQCETRQITGQDQSKTMNEPFHHLLRVCVVNNWLKRSDCFIEIFCLCGFVLEDQRGSITKLQ
jgi:hypothetical protein